MKVLVTGAAGFIGFHVARRLVADGHQVVGADNLSDYYDVQLKRDRLAQLEGESRFSFRQIDLGDRDGAAALFVEEDVDSVIHLAAQAGVRYSLRDPHTYLRSNVDAFLNVLEGCRHHRTDHLIFASSSSVYGANTALPFSTHQNVDHPLSLYAATKKADELMAHAYANLYGVAATGLRFFTVYGPWGRPDMAMFRFAEAILSGQPIELYNKGRMRRDFTYVDDVVEAVVRLLPVPARAQPGWSGAHPDPATSFAPYRVYNIGNSSPVEVLDLIELLEKLLDRTAEKKLLPMQPGDVPATYADIDDLARDVGFSPATPIERGVQRFLDWYRPYREARGAPLSVRD